MKILLEGILDEWKNMHLVWVITGNCMCSLVLGIAIYWTYLIGVIIGNDLRKLSLSEIWWSRKSCALSFYIENYYLHGCCYWNVLRQISVSFWPVNSVGQMSDQKKLCLWEMKDQKNLCLCWKFICPKLHGCHHW